MLAITLSGYPYRQPGQPTAITAPSSLAALPINQVPGRDTANIRRCGRSPTLMLARAHARIRQGTEARDVDNLALALRTFGTFDFKGACLAGLPVHACDVNAGWSHCTGTGRAIQGTA